jgi:hypothetical protein
VSVSYCVFGRSQICLFTEPKDAMEASSESTIG